MKKQRVLIVSDSIPIVSSLEKVLRTLGYETGQVDESYSHLLVDLDHSPDITPYIHLRKFEILPTILFLSSLPATHYLNSDSEEGTLPRHSYLVRKYESLYTLAKGEHFVADHFFKFSQLTDILQRLSKPLDPEIKNVFRNVYSIFQDFKLEKEADTQTLHRFNSLDRNLCREPRERELSRLKEFHSTENKVWKQMILDLVMDNIQYLQAGEPTRKVLWIEDRPDGKIQHADGKTTSLKSDILNSFEYYKGISVFLLKNKFATFLSNLTVFVEHGKTGSFVKHGKTGSGLFSNLELQNISGRNVNVNDFNVERKEGKEDWIILLDLHFEDEKQISGKDLIPLLTEAAPRIPIVIFTKSADPEFMDSVLHSGGDFCLSKSYPYYVPVYVNRCYDIEGRDAFFIAKSKLRQSLIDTRHQLKIKLDTPELQEKYKPEELLNNTGVSLIADGVEQEDESPTDEEPRRIPRGAPDSAPGELGEEPGFAGKKNEGIFITRTVLRWRDVFLYRDDVRLLGKYLEIHGQSEKAVTDALNYFRLNDEKLIEKSYLKILQEGNFPGWKKTLNRFHDKFGKMVFGSVSGILTPMGMLVGVYAATREFTAVMASIAAVGASDSWSDAYAKYSEEIQKPQAKRKDAFYSARKTLEAKMIFPGLFLLVLWFVDWAGGDIKWGIMVVLILAAILLAGIGAEKELIEEKVKFLSVAKAMIINLFLAVVVLFFSWVAGYGIQLLFGT